MGHRITALAVVFFAVGSLSGCSEIREPATGDGAAACPDFSGTWQIVDHCETSFIGMSVPVTQTGCSHVSGAPFDGFTGTVSSTGVVTVNGMAGTDVIMCSGQLNGNAVDLSCNDGCTLVSLRRGGGE